MWLGNFVFPELPACSSSQVEEMEWWNHFVQMKQNIVSPACASGSDMDVQEDVLGLLITNSERQCLRLPWESLAHVPLDFIYGNMD